MTRKPPPDRVQATWDLLTAPPSDEDVDAEMDAIEKLDAHERARELEEGGFHLQEVAADARGLRERLQRSAAATPPAAPEAGDARPLPDVPRTAPAVDAIVPRTAPAVDAIAPRARPRRRSTELLSGFAVALMLLLLAIGFALRPHGDRETPIARPDLTGLPSPSEAPSAAPTDATALRTRAATACNQQSWIECRDLLQRAAHLDPAGESDPAIQALHQHVEMHLPPPRMGPKP
jgi:hypothetical protein